jgi:DNA-binding LacI/PurR family transcriptional regulator
MKPLRPLSITEQTVEFLRQGLQDGRWRGKLPGVVRLATECNISTGVVRAALQQLEAEGLLTAQGLGRCRAIVPAGVRHTKLRPLRIGILLHDAKFAQVSDQGGRVVLEIQRKLEALDHSVFFTKKSQGDLKHNVHLITRQIEATAADAWIIVAGSSAVLEWFANQTVPCIALYGRTGGLSIARTGPEKIPALIAATRHLIHLGHRRIVLIAPGPRRKPTPGRAERAFLDELTAHGIGVGDYHLPDWEETPKGLTALLEKLFHTTPPTALIIDEAPQFIAIMQFLAKRGIQVPSQISMVSTDSQETLAWCNPPISHVAWDPKLIVRHLVRWMADVQRGKQDRKTVNFPAVFIPGESIGPAPKKN